MGARSWRIGVGTTLGFVAFLLSAPAPLRAQRVRTYQIQGIVLDEFSHAPVKRADVSLLGAKGKLVGRELTGPGGRFELTLPKFGAYAIEVHALGYTPFLTHVFVADTSQEVSAQVNLAPAPLALKGLSVTTTALQKDLEKVGFYERKKLGFGYYLTPKELEDKTTDRITDDFYGLPGVQVRRVASSPGALWDVTMHGANTQYLGGTCYPSIYVDGDMVRHGGNTATQEETAGLWTELVDPSNVAAIEVYPNPGGLPPFAAGSDSPCGTVLIWTRSALRHGAR